LHEHRVANKNKNGITAAILATLLVLSIFTIASSLILNIAGVATSAVFTL
jgi:hypothetical protein